MSEIILFTDCTDGIRRTASSESINSISFDEAAILHAARVVKEKRAASTKMAEEMVAGLQNAAAENEGLSHMLSSISNIVDMQKSEAESKDVKLETVLMHRNPQAVIFYENGIVFAKDIIVFESYAEAIAHMKGGNV